MNVHYSEALARNYDADYGILRDSIGDREFYAQLARDAKGPVLEIGCGTGRVLLPIAAAGIECVGVDPSPEMLNVLRGKSPPSNLTLALGSATAFDLTPKRFGLVYAAFRVFQHLLDVDSQLAALANVRRHLATGGRFAFDVFAPDLVRIAAKLEPAHEDVRTQDGDVEVRRIVWVERDHATQVQRVWFRYERWQRGTKLGEDVSNVAMRWFHRFEIEHLLARAGFEVENVYGGYDRRPYDGNGEIVVSARARA